MKSIKYYNIDTLTDLSTVKFSGDSTDSTYFTYSNTTPQSGTPDIPWHSVCSVSSVNQIYSHGKFYFPGKSGYSGTVYGVQWDTSDPSPECTRIGNMSLHATLPVQSQMVGGLMLDDGTFNEFGNQSDWTSYTRDGSLGQVMVKIPTFWIKFETLGNIYRVLMSSEPVIGFKMVKEMYCSAYEAALDRTNLKLSSVVNKTAQYRGGNNNANWDSEDTAGNGGESHRSLLGRPATSISLTDFRTYARNRGSSAWNCYFYLMHKILYWLYVVEYATLNSQKEFNSSLDSNGFHQGGLGDGVTDWEGASWSNFNGNYPLVSCGWTDDYGNTTANKNFSVYNSSGTVLKTFRVPRYRGIENPFGHLWEWVDGILLNVTETTSDIYVTENPNEFSSDSYSDYDFIGNSWRGQGYIKELTLGDGGDITTKGGVGSSSSYYCDYYYTEINNLGIFGYLFSGYSTDFTRSGFTQSFTSDRTTYYRTVTTSRLTYFDAWRDVVYEEYEWLKGDGSAYIDTLTALSDSDTVQMKITGGTLPSSSQAYKLIFGNNTTSYNYNTWVLFWNSSLAIRPTKTSSADEYRFQISTSQELTISQSTTSINVNGTEVWSGTSAYTEIADKCKLFSAGTNVSQCYDGQVAYLRIPDKLNMIPCTLTMDLPASMDANNIARTKGTSGMWDLVSDRFYGNVANSGTFKAVNLAEGVDYEVHQWLKGDPSSYIKLDNHYNTDELAYIETVAQLYDNSTPHVAIIIGNNNSDDNGGYCLRMTFTNPQDLCDAHRRGNGHQDSVRNLFNNDYGVHTYYLSLNDFIVDGVSYPFTYGSRFDDIMDVPYTRVVFGSTKFNSIKLRANNTTFSLIPVKLLKSIPAKYDGNGIARQAGECGMYDTVSGKFFGNVANRGTFSVSD